MALPDPHPGLVISYSYLWADEHEAGHEEGLKDRPCAIVLVVVDQEAGTVVTVVPVTHAPPARNRPAIEIPHDTKRRLGLDDARSWIVLDEANEFIWPGPDLRPRESGKPETVAFGFLPRGLIKSMRARFAEADREGKSRQVTRTE